MHVKQFGRIWKWANVLHESIARNDNMMTPKQKIFSLATTGECGCEWVSTKTNTPVYCYPGISVTKLTVTEAKRWMIRCLLSTYKQLYPYLCLNFIKTLMIKFSHEHEYHLKVEVLVLSQKMLYLYRIDLINMGMTEQFCQSSRHG